MRRYVNNTSKQLAMAAKAQLANVWRDGGSEISAGVAYGENGRSIGGVIMKAKKRRLSRNAV